MARVKSGKTASGHQRTLKLAKGYRGARSKQYKIAKQSVMRALTASYSGRKERKRQFRRLWITRINAAARINGLSYSQFMYGIKLMNVSLNRKMLSELAVNDAVGFAVLAERARKIIIEFPDWPDGDEAAISGTETAIV
ncbi:MAG: 50S ribosomal protein L20 [Lachnospiraceae bacterium]|nr:50S ribosomal protein L20 [Lachnospiraceae bacterium]